MSRFLLLALIFLVLRSGAQTPAISVAPVWTAPIVMKDGAKIFPSGVLSHISSGQVISRIGVLKILETNQIVGQGVCGYIPMASDPRHHILSTNSTNYIWFPTIMKIRASIREKPVVFVWVDDQREFFQAYEKAILLPQAEKRLKVASTASSPSEPEPKRSSGENRAPGECESDHEICFDKDGIASFSFGCSGVTLTVSTKGEFAVGLKGDKASGSITVLGGK